MPAVEQTRDGLRDRSLSVLLRTRLPCRLPLKSARTNCEPQNNNSTEAKKRCYSLVIHAPDISAPIYYLLYIVFGLYIY